MSDQFTDTLKKILAVKRGERITVVIPDYRDGVTAILAMKLNAMGWANDFELVRLNNTLLVTHQDRKAVVIVVYGSDADRRKRQNEVKRVVVRKSADLGTKIDELSSYFLSYVDESGRDIFTASQAERYLKK